MLLYEIHTRAWLAELSAQSGERITLGNLPESVIEEWIRKDFTHIWLMGVWKTGRKAREVAVTHWRNQWRHEVPSTESDVSGSPFAIQAYKVAEELGSWEDLLQLRQRLEGKGLVLITDFIPNHFGLDTPALIEHPSLFVESHRVREGVFEFQTRFGRKFFAHGKDPYFPPWRDTVQLDYRLQSVHEYMIRRVASISEVSGGIRCDMSMLLLREIFERNWSDYPIQRKDVATGEFWESCFASVKATNPGCIMVAEAYWDTEERLQEMGFDFTYNKRVYDYIVRRQTGDLVNFLLARPPDFLERGVTFLENHDEPRVTTLLDWPEHKAGLFLMMGLPGMVLLHEGQLQGSKAFARIQMCQRLQEEKDKVISSFYDELLQKMKATPLRKGKCELLKCQPGEPGSAGFLNCFATIWESNGGEPLLTIVNLSGSPVRVKIQLPARLSRRQINPMPFFATDSAVQTVPNLQKGEFIFDLGGHFGQWLKLIERQ